MTVLSSPGPRRQFQSRPKCSLMNRPGIVPSARRKAFETGWSETGPLDTGSSQMHLYLRLDPAPPIGQWDETPFDRYRGSGHLSTPATVRTRTPYHFSISDRLGDRSGLPGHLANPDQTWCGSPGRQLLPKP